MRVWLGLEHGQGTWEQWEKGLAGLVIRQTWQQGKRNPSGTSRGCPCEEVHGIPDRSLVNSNTFKHWTAATEVPCQETAEKAWPLPFRIWQLTLILQPNADAWTPSARLKKASAFPKYAERPHRAPHRICILPEHQHLEETRHRQRIPWESLREGLHLSLFFTPNRECRV